jgi:hypothetical protein
VNLGCVYLMLNLTSLLHYRDIMDILYSSDFVPLASTNLHSLCRLCRLCRLGGYPWISLPSPGYGSR